MVSENEGHLSRFFAWWFGELRACLPKAISGVLFGAAERLEVALDAREARFVLRSNGEARELGRVDPFERDTPSVQLVEQRLEPERVLVEDANTSVGVEFSHVVFS